MLKAYIVRLSSEFHSEFPIINLSYMQVDSELHMLIINNQEQDLTQFDTLGKLVNLTCGKFLFLVPCVQQDL